jgi:tRNA wybutosine-synthesizing protein 4
MNKNGNKLLPKFGIHDDEDDEYSNDYKTESTASDAIGSKFSAISLKYYDDYFLKIMFESQLRHFIRKPPIINRGYYARVKIIEKMLNKFLEITEKIPHVQIISLGSGLDTLSYKILSAGIEKHRPGIRYFEIDFENVIRKKAVFTMKTEILSKIISKSFECSEPPKLQKISEDEEANEFDCEASSENKSIESKPNYKTSYGYQFESLHLLNADLRHSDAVQSALLDAGVDMSLPTFILTECVLVYIEKKHVLSLMSMLSSQLQNALWISYDMVHPNDAFGRTMLSNLTNAGHKIPGFIEYPNLESQVQRYLESGWEMARSCTMLRGYLDIISEEEKTRLSGLEIFDEFEEWELIMNHYALSGAVKGNMLIDIINSIPNQA